jgi:hypothetical protein
MKLHRGTKFILREYQIQNSPIQTLNNSEGKDLYMLQSRVTSSSQLRIVHKDQDIAIIVSNEDGTVEIVRFTV